MLCYNFNNMIKDDIYNVGDVPENWDDSDIKIRVRNTKKTPFITKLFFYTLTIFILISIFITYLFLSKKSTFYENRIIITPTSQLSITSGEATKINISVKNNNLSAISDSYLYITYDSGENLSGGRNIKNIKENLGEILANSEIQKSIPITLFGAEGTFKDIDISLFYKTKGSNAEFQKDSDPISIMLKASPVSINVKALKEIHKGYQLDFLITVKNNTNNDIENLIVTARNPNNFIFSSSSPESVDNKSTWKIEKLKAKAEYNISMSGKPLGEIGDELFFTFYTGLSENIDKNNLTSTNTLANFDNFELNIDNIYSKIEKNVKITGQYLDLSFSEDLFNIPDNFLQNDTINFSLIYKNNTSNILSNIEVDLQLLGDDIENVEVIDGYYDKNSKKILWNKNTLENLSKLNSYESGLLRFILRVKREAKIGNEIRIIGKIKGERTDEDNVSNIQDISIDKTWKIIE